MTPVNRVYLIMHYTAAFRVKSPVPEAPETPEGRGGRDWLRRAPKKN